MTIVYPITSRTLQSAKAKFIIESQGYSEGLYVQAQDIQCNINFTDNREKILEIYIYDFTTTNSNVSYCFSDSSNNTLYAKEAHSVTKYWIYLAGDEDYQVTLNTIGRFTLDSQVRYYISVYNMYDDDSVTLTCNAVPPTAAPVTATSVEAASVTVTTVLFVVIAALVSLVFLLLVACIIFYR